MLRHVELLSDGPCQVRHRPVTADGGGVIEMQTDAGDAPAVEGRLGSHSTIGDRTAQRGVTIVGHLQRVANRTIQTGVFFCIYVLKFYFHDSYKQITINSKLQ